jgi:hypothetical protein
MRESHRDVEFDGLGGVGLGVAMREEVVVGGQTWMVGGEDGKRRRAMMVFAIRHLPFVVCHLPFTACLLPLAICHLLFAACCNHHQCCRSHIHSCCRHCTTNDNDVTPISNGSSLTPTSNDSMDVTPTSPTAVTERRKYKKRGGNGFIQIKGSMKAKYMYHTSNKPRQAKTNTVAMISALSADMSCIQNVVKLVIEDVRKLIHLYYIKIEAPLPEDWHGKGSTK